MERVDTGSKQKIKRFLASHQLPGIKGEKLVSKTISNDEDEMEEIDSEDIEYFNPDFTDVHRVVSCSEPTCCHSTAQTQKELCELFITDNSDEDPVNDILYLVKWRALPYSDCTWEKWGDIRTSSFEVFHFWKRQIPPPLQYLSSSRPSLHEYQTLDKSPVFGIVNEDFSDKHSSSSQSCDSSGLLLRDYQLEGVNWLLWNWWHKRSSILADEMGLGVLTLFVFFY
jgi:hypothetical protein